MEEEQRLMQKAASDTLNDIDKKCLRALQIKMYHCSIDCCKNSDSVETLEKCNEICARDTLAAHNYVQNEFNKWHQRTQRCVQDCYDIVTERTQKPAVQFNENEMNKHIKEGEACASQCVMKHIKTLPVLSSKIIDYLSIYSK